jgi:hypothetical protein
MTVAPQGGNRIVLVLLTALLSCLASAPLVHGGTLDDIQARIKQLETKEREIETALQFWNTTLMRLRSGDYVAAPITYEGSSVAFAMPKNEMNQSIAAKVLTGEWTAERAQRVARNVGELTRRMITEASAEIGRLEQAQRKTKDDLSYNLNERARLKEQQPGSPTKTAKAGPSCTLTGVWYYQGDRGYPPSYIQGGGGGLMIDNGQGSRSKGRLENGRIIADDWKVTGDLVENGCRINWSNWTWWAKVP